MRLAVWVVDEHICPIECLDVFLDFIQIPLFRWRYSPRLGLRFRGFLFELLLLDGDKRCTDVIVESADELPAERVDCGDAHEVIVSEAPIDYRDGILRIRDNAY